MKITLLCFIAAIFFTATTENSWSQPTLKRGQEFWVGAFPRIYTEDATLPQPAKVHSANDTLRLVIYSDAPTHVDISIPRTGWKRSVFTKDSSAYIVTLPKDSVVAWHTDTAEDKGIHVIADRPITLNCYNLVPNLSDASLIYPKEILGNEYIVSCQYIYNPALLLIVATEDATKVTIEPSIAAWGSTREIMLERGQVYFLQAQADPTGLRINADKHVAVYSGVYIQDADPSIVPGYFGNGDGNITYDQLLPVKEWSKVHYSVPMDASINTNKYPTWTRIVASQNNTLVKINGRQITLNRGKWIDSISNHPLAILADKPVAVTQMASGIIEASGFPPEISGIMGDGTFLQLLGKEKMISGRSLFMPVPSLGKVKLTVDDDFAGRTFVDYITVITPTAERNAVYLDGKSLATDFRPFLFDTAMSYAQIQVTKGKHELWSTGRYHLYSYGWGYSEAYSNTAGISLGARKPAISHVPACIGVPVELRGYAEAGAIRWWWDFADGTPETASTGAGQSPAGDDLTKVLHTFSKTGTYQVRLRILYDWSNGVEDTVYRTVTVNELPVPVLTASHSELCYGEAGKIFASTGFVKYVWSHDGSIIQPNPLTPAEITVTRSGNYTVSVTNANGCTGSATISITVLPELIAGIKGAKEACLESIEEYSAEALVGSDNKNITYAWGATPGGKIISEWNKPVVRIQWIGEGKQTLTFQMIDHATNCSKDTTISVMVGTSLTVAITGKKVICEGMITELHAESVENENLRYEWSYNGQLISGENDSNIIADKAGKYSVKIISASGCQGDAVTEVVVAPLLDAPQITGRNILCSEKDTLLLNLTSPEKYYHRQWLLDNTPIPGDTFGILKVSKPGTYSVAVYNDAGCERIAQFTVVRFLLNLSSDTTICPNSSVQLLAETPEGFSNILYRWSPADGLSNSGIANPVATPNITTTYRLYATTQEGLCTIEDSVTITVIPALKIKTQDITICKGETSQLALTIENQQGQGELTYSWSPAAGLSDPTIANPLVTGTETRSYSVTITNEKGCSVEQTLTVYSQEREDIRAEIVGEKESVEPGESSAITLQIWSRFKELTSFKATIKYDKSVFQYVRNSAVFLLGTVNDWEIFADEKEPGVLSITASGTTPIQTTILGFELAAYLADQADTNISLTLEEVNGAPVVVESNCMEIQVRSTDLSLDNICAGDLRLVNISLSPTALQAIMPNPVVDNAVKIQYSVGLPGEASVEIYNQQGVLVATLAKGHHVSGSHAVILDTTTLSAGVYLCKFTTPQVIQTEMFTIVR